MSAKTLLTTYGNDKILEAIAESSTVAIVAIAYGDGNGEQYEPSVDQTSLRNEVGRLNSIVREFNETEGFIYFKGIIPANADPFVLREFGLIDSEGGLISVTVVPDIEKPVASDGVSIALPISIGFKTSTGEIMIVVEDGTDVYANTSLSNLNNIGEHHFDNTYATIDLDNLSLTGERHFLGRTHITNCITEVPQRIKYTLDDGILTVKAGSVIIVPYGTVDLSSTYPINSIFLNDNFKVVDTQYSNSKFFVWAAIQNDMSMTYTTGAYHLSTFVDVENNALVSYDRFSDSSGASVTPGLTVSLYNTTDNTVSRYSAGTQTVATMSFPILRMTSTDSQIASVDELFNGISHIGSIAILDKGVRLLIPKGRNDNGSLNNEVFITENLIMSEIAFPTNSTYNLYYDYTNNSIACLSIYDCFSSAPNDSLAQDRVYYDFTTNTFTQYYSNVQYNHLYCQIGTLYRDKDHSQIANFNAKMAFRASDYNDVASITNVSFGSGEIGDPIITLSNDLADNEVWLEGATVSRTSYAKLFAIYGTTYGAGDGSTTFVLPDFRNRAIWGADGFGYIGAGLPNITGGFTGGTNYGGGGQQWGAFGIYGYTGNVDPGDGRAHVNCNYNFDAARSSNIYGKSSTVQPPSIKVRVKTRYI